MNDQVSLICVCDKLPFSCSIQYNLNENSRLIGGAIMAHMNSLKAQAEESVLRELVYEEDIV